MGPAEHTHKYIYIYIYVRMKLNFIYDNSLICCLPFLASTKIGLFEKKL